MKTIFLDIQGCLTCGESKELTQLPIFEECLRASGMIDELQIVISSDWRHAYNLDQLRELFSPDIATRIVDVTGPEAWSREREVLQYVEEFEIDEWIAIDDLRDDFENPLYLICCDRAEGFTMQRGAELLEFLDRYPGPFTGHGPWSHNSGA